MTSLCRPPLPLLLLLLFCSSPRSLHALHQLPLHSPALGQRSSSIFERVKQEPSCRPIDIALCRDIPYNRTILPNPFVGDIDVQSLQSQTEHFKPLIKTKCSPHLLFFICSAFAPMCPEQLPQAVTSCREVCEEVQRDCIKIFHEFDFPWPPVLNCSRFPSPPHLCMRPEPTAPPVVQPDRKVPRKSERLPECPQDLVDLDPGDPGAKCAFRCEKSTMFRKDAKEQARLWLTMCAFLNAAVAAFTVCSFWIDRHRFAFPERAICFVALCSLASSLPHLLRLVVRPEQLACAQLPSGARFLALQRQQHLPPWCLVSFLLHYYFSMAASLWWTALTFTWYLSAARKWAEEAIGKRSLLLHLCAWGLPALGAGAAYSSEQVDASELLGICSLGNADPNALLWAWIVPRMALTLGGLYLLLAGFSAMGKERNSFRRRGTDTSKLDKFMWKMGSFAALYSLPALVSTFCDLHHLSVLLLWQPHTVDCKHHGGAFSGECIRPEQPQPGIFVAGATLALTAGLATGLWMFSPKTLISWKRTLFCCGEQQTKLKGAQAVQQQFAKAPSFAAMSSYRPHSSLLVPSSSLLNPPHQQSRPLLSAAAAMPPRDPPPLPPPPPTAAPSSAAYNGFYPPLSLSSHSHYIPLSIMPSGTSGPPNGGGVGAEHQSGF